ncbi:MAG: hypothetical protein H0T42_32680 [Deltaproteobacteria bacterium]|nr:hypothetical protein [Deltaproteobacteria bacterium]
MPPPSSVRGTPIGYTSGPIRIAVQCDDVTYRRKTWMSSGAAEWLRGSGGAVVGRILLRPDAAIARYVQGPALREIWQTHQAGTTDATVSLLILLALETWLQLFIESPTPAMPLPRLSEMR